uniref:Uncharacterized protein n=1 Tax=uncultured marine virus TaxID=186617 RepID=A0A0F7L8X2_9VIRU|nr:hypothetical protein [uncultured marine virus]
MLAWVPLTKLTVTRLPWLSYTSTTSSGPGVNPRSIKVSVGVVVGSPTKVFFLSMSRWIVKPSRVSSSSRSSSHFISVNRVSPSLSPTTNRELLMNSRLRTLKGILNLLHELTTFSRPLKKYL